MKKKYPFIFKKKKKVILKRSGNGVESEESQWKKYILLKSKLWIISR